MSNAVEVPPASNTELSRVLGSVVGPNPGPTLVGVGGLHGNEPAGVIALQRVLAVLSEQPHRVRGEFVALAGNLRALAERRRFIDRDLNRAWTSDRTQALRVGQLNAESEDQEHLELLAAFDEVRARARGPVCIVDYHTTSGPGGVFTTVSDRLPNREFAMAIPVPLVLGLEELVDGTLMDFLDREGLVAMSFESGQHTEAAAVDRAIHGTWLSLAHAGLIEAGRDEVRDAHAALASEFAHLPPVVEMRYRHGLEESTGFEMLEGYESFQQIRADELLGHDDDGDVRAARRGRILMPLYQVQGDDGFFIVRDFNAFWLRVSSRMREWRLDRYVHLLPGVSKVEARPGALYVNRRVARWYALELLHLLGYRRMLEAGKRLIVIKRGTTDRPQDSE